MFVVINKRTGFEFEREFDTKQEADTFAKVLREQTGVNLYWSALKGINNQSFNAAQKKRAEKKRIKGE